MKEIFDIAKLTEPLLKNLIAQTPKILIIFGLSWLALRGMRIIAARMERGLSGDPDPLKQEAKNKRAKTLTATVSGALKALIFVLAGSMILEELGIKIGPILASIGFVGLAFGFGAQSLVKDVVTGFFLLAENQYGVGDVVSIAGVSGQVESITLRITTLRDVKGVVHHIPNGQVAVVSNMTKEWSRALLDVGVGYGENVDRALKTLRAVCDRMREDEKYKQLLLEDFEILGVESLDDSSVTLRLMVKTVPLKQWEVQRELRRRIKNSFDEQGIEIPFPQRAVWIRGGESAEAKNAVE